MRSTKSTPDTSNFWQNALSVAVLQTKSPTKRFIFDTEPNLPPWLRSSAKQRLTRSTNWSSSQSRKGGKSGDLIFRKPQNWSNSASSHRASLRYTLRPGEASFFLSCLLLNDSHSCMRIPGTLEGRSCSFLFDFGAARSIVDLQTFPTLCNRVKILSSFTKLRSVEGREMLVERARSSIVCIGMQTCSAKFIVCPELAWDVILGADFLPYTNAVLNFAEGTFSTHRATGAITDTSLPKDDVHDICNALFEAAAILMSNLDDLCAQLTHIPNDERKELRQLLLKYANIFSWQGARLGRTNIVKHKICTGEARSIWQPHRRIPPPLLEEVNRLVEEMLRDEVIKPSKSPWASPIALVKKNDGSLRLCIDFMKLNAVTKKNAFPLPHINDSLDSLHGSQWFSTLDLKSGYWQVEVAEADREKTAFILPNGLYEFPTMLFEFCNAAATFQRLMQTALIGLFPKHCIIYLDDIPVFGGDIQEHNANLKLVLDRLRDAGLTLNSKKYRFLLRSVTFLGHAVSSNGIAVTDDRVQKVRTWPTPSNQKELCSFLGLANYYRRFVKGLAKIASPLHKLTDKPAKKNFKWEKEHDEAFKDLI
uniref:KRAB A domain containing protein n=1 Tax=Echinococcus granulosus TaxID=6210 RepID=A0A068X4W8_ECHGR|nr:KRAB A domain containing protein [Echinococcus granulosus]